MTPEEGIREFKAWAAGHSGLPVLSDEAISRESIYEPHAQHRDARTRPKGNLCSDQLKYSVETS